MQSNGGEMSHILRLPPEILLRASGSLTTIELGHFRQTCKFVEQILFDSFAKEFFSKRQFMLEEHSLQALVDIAHHPSLSNYLKYVIVSAERLSSPVQRRIQLQNGRMDAETLIWTGRARDMLVEAFSGLPNLQTVGVRAQSGPERSRDGPDSRWRSYGWSLGIEQMSPESARSHRRHPSLHHNGKESATFALVVNALAEAHVNPEGIEVFINTGRGLDQASFGVLNGRSEPRVREMLGKLKRLLLTVGSVHDPQDLAPIKRFLLAAEGVEALRLNMVNCQDEDSLLKWTASSPDRNLPLPTTELASEDTPTDTVAHDSLVATQGLRDNNEAKPRLIPPSGLFLASPPFAHLRRLDLGFANITPGVLLRLLTRLQLHELNLWKIILVTEHRATGLEEAQQLWPNFLRVFSKSDQPLLRTIVIGEVVAGPVELSLSGPIPYVGVRWSVEGDAAHHGPPSLPVPSLTQIKYHAQSGRSVGEWLIEAADRIERVEQLKVCMLGHGRWEEARPFIDPMLQDDDDVSMTADDWDEDDEEGDEDEDDEDEDDEDD